MRRIDDDDATVPGGLPGPHASGRRTESRAIPCSCYNYNVGHACTAWPENACASHGTGAVIGGEEIGKPDIERARAV